MRSVPDLTPATVVSVAAPLGSALDATTTAPCRPRLPWRSELASVVCVASVESPASRFAFVTATEPPTEDTASVPLTGWVTADPSTFHALTPPVPGLL